MRSFNEFEERNLTFLTQKSIEYTLVQITATGYKKSILDATVPMRRYFKEKEMHDFSAQLQGKANKIAQESYFLDENVKHSTRTMLYRPLTKKGDPRIWPRRLKKHCSPDDILLMIYHNEKLYIINLTKVDLNAVYLSPKITPLKELIEEVHNAVRSVAIELADLLRKLASEWHPTAVLADTGVGRAIEALLGINMNNDKNPDYRGIELKSSRDKRSSIRSTLFCQVPNWGKSHLGSANAIVQKYGYDRNGHLTYHNTLRCTTPNSQNLGLTLYQSDELLAIEEKKNSGKEKEYMKVADVAVWELSLLHKRLLEKHRETFWIEVETKIENGVELFRPIWIEHTKNPLVSQFETLLDTGYISVDLLLSRPNGRGDTVAFKIKKKARSMLFPESERIELR